MSALLWTSRCGRRRVSTLWCRRYHRVMALVSRTWFNRPSDLVRPTTRSLKANRGRHRLREVVMAQILGETNSFDVRCYRADAGSIGSSPAWQGVLAAAVRVATTEATVFSKASRAPARKSSPGSFTRRRRGNTARSSPSTARHCPNNCSSPSCLGTNAVRSRAPSSRRRDTSSWQREGSCSSMR